MRRLGILTLTALAICSCQIALASTPSLITMYNGRPGARIVLHLYPENGCVRTSTLGMPYPRNVSKRNLYLINEPDGKSASAIPLSSDSRIAVDAISSQQWGLSCNGLTSKSGVTFRVRSPYQRFEKLADNFISKATTAPLFVLDVQINNPSSKELNGKFLLGMDNALAVCSKSGFSGVTLKDLDSGNNPTGGELCIAGDASLKPLISKDILAEFAGVASQESSNVQGGLVWKYSIPANSSSTKHFVFAGFINKPLMSDFFTKESLTLHYTKWWKSSEDVAAWGVKNLQALVDMNEKLEKSCGIRTVDDNRRFVISQSVAEHLADTHLLQSPDGPLVWMYSEAGFSGGYLSTVDLIPDTFLFNKLYLPWTLRLLVDLHARYIVQDGLGAYVTHDVGSSNFEQRGNYGESGAGHRMPVEETCNYIHLMWLTWCETHDKAMLEKYSPQMIQLLDSLCARDKDGDGIPDSQSNLAESNTFDNGALIGTTKKSTYLGLKVWTSARFLAVMLSEINKESASAKAADLADRAEKTLVDNYKANGYLWTLLDTNNPNHAAQCLWVTKGLFTAYITGFNMEPYRDIEQACIQHTKTVAPNLRREFGYAFDSVPTNRVTWQSQSMLIDLMGRNYWGIDLGLPDMMANSGRVSGVLNEFVGPNSGLAKDTEWPAEQVYSRMASAVGWLPGTMPKAVYKKPILIRWCASGCVMSSDGHDWLAKELKVSSSKPQFCKCVLPADMKQKELFDVLMNGVSGGLKWKTGILPEGTYYVKMLGNETGLLGGLVKAAANGIKLTSSRAAGSRLDSKMPAMVCGIVHLTKPAAIEVKLTGVPRGSGVSALEISSEPTSTHILLDIPSKLSVALSSPRLRADGEDSLDITANLCNDESSKLNVNGIPIKAIIKSGDAKIEGDSTLKTVNGEAAFHLTAGKTSGNVVVDIKAPSMPPVEKRISVGGTVAYLVDVGRDGGAAMDSRNRLWLGDCRYSADTGYGSLDDCSVSKTTDSILNTSDAKLYQTYVWSRKEVKYQFDTYEAGDYLIRLMFVESYFGTSAAPANTGIGSRIINAAINGKAALTGFDIFKEAGGPNIAVDKNFILHIDKPEPIIVKLDSSVNSACIAGIEVRESDDGDKSAVRL